MDTTLSELLSAATLCHEEKDYKNAIIFYEKALVFESNLPQVYVSIGNICLELEALNDALLYYEQALLLDKNNFVAYSNIASVFQKNNQLQEAQEYYKKALEINPNYINALYNLSYIFLIQREYIKGFREYRFRYNEEIRGKKPGGVAYPPTLLTPEDEYENKVLYISHEQGFGDTIQFIRFLPFFAKKAKEIISYVPPTMLKLFTLSYPDINFISAGENISFDYNFPMLESPYLLGMSYEEIPFNESYLHVQKNDSLAFQKKHKITSKKIKIGINYKGSLSSNSSIELSLLLNTLQQLDKNIFEIYSLQFERTEEENLLLKKNNIVNLGQFSDTFYDTALMISNMDIVISIDTSVLHLAGAMGKKSFALLKFHPDWRWGLDDSQTNWYKNTTLLRQEQANQWDNVLDELLDKLEQLA